WYESGVGCGWGRAPLPPEPGARGPGCGACIARVAMIGRPWPRVRRVHRTRRHDRAPVAPGATRGARVAVIGRPWPRVRRAHCAPP
ncbi:MAG: hypothetical protein AAGI01_12310, partial [Myxococcota bacterium]